MQENEMLRDQSQPATPPTDPNKMLFSLRYRIPVEEYYQFHLMMGAESANKNRKRTSLLGWVEVGVGVMLIGAMAFNKTDAGVFYFVLAAIMILMGLYGAFYYKLIYPRSLHKAVTKQYKNTPYLLSEIQVDFYPNRCVEHVGEKAADNFWHTIKDLRETPALFLIMLAERRCLLIPKTQLSDDDKQRMDDLFTLIHENYEKRRVRV